MTTDWLSDLTNLGMAYIEKNAPAQQNTPPQPAPAMFPATAGGISTTTILWGVGAIVAVILVVKVGKLL